MKQMLMIVSVAAGVLVLILIIIIVVLAIKLRRCDDDFYDDDYEDDESYEKDEIYEEEQVNDEVEIEFYEMPAKQSEATDEENEMEIEFYEMTVEAVSSEEKEEIDPEIPDMEALLVKEIMKENTGFEKASSVKEKEQPPKRVVTPIEFDDDSDLEFIELD